MQFVNTGLSAVNGGQESQIATCQRCGLPRKTNIRVKLDESTKARTKGEMLRPTKEATRNSEQMKTF